MQDEQGIMKVLICTNAGGMGVIFSGVYSVVQYGPSKEIGTYVQMEIAGRGDVQFQDVIIYKSHHSCISIKAFC